MRRKFLHLLAAAMVVGLHGGSSAGATALPSSVLTGKFVNWRESTRKVVGDGVHQITMDWSINTLHKGWFYGTSDSDVAFAAGAAKIEDITDASSLSYVAGSIGPHNDAATAANHVGDFIVWRNRSNGYYAALRIDDINPNLNSGPNFGHDDDFLQGTWWFQSNGTDNFSSVPEPASLGLGLGVTWAIVVIGRARRQRAQIGTDDLRGKCQRGLERVERR
jgi:hypothetical protein